MKPSNNKNALRLLALDELGLEETLRPQFNAVESVYFSMDVIEEWPELLKKIQRPYDCILLLCRNINKQKLMNLERLLVQHRNIPTILITNKINETQKKHLYPLGLTFVFDEKICQQGMLPAYMLPLLEKQAYVYNLMCSEEKYKNYFKLLKSGMIKKIHAPQTESGYLIVKDAVAPGDDEMLLHLKEAAYHDYLTKIPNRKYFDDTVQKQIARAKRLKESFYLCLIDIDHFKTINDIHGHDIGDALLKEVAKKLQDILRSMDFCARLGGDEFAIVLSDPNSTNASVKIAKRLLKTLSTTYTLMKKKLNISVSIGIANYEPYQNMTFNELMKKADLALYAAKEKGRNQFQFFESNLGKSHQHFHNIEAALHTAIKHQEFNMLYQPIVDLDTLEVASLEALIRWNSSVLSTKLLPDEFIPIAESSKHMIAITNIVMDLVFKDIKQWQDAGSEVPPISINCSALDLISNSFIDRLQAAMKKYSINPEQIQIELTETTIMKHHKTASKAIESIRGLKIPISIDDFGTGYSSLARLREISFDFIKIDRAFTVSMLSDTNSMQIVRAVIDLTKQLGITVIAEGVEQEEAANFLKSWGCSFAQGHYFSEPLKATRVSDFVRRQNGSNLPKNRGLPGTISHYANQLRKIGHDINNQLASILGYTEIILNKVQALTDDYNVARSIHTAITDAINVLNQLSLNVRAIQSELANTDSPSTSLLKNLQIMGANTGQQLSRSIIQIEFSILPVINHKKDNLDEAVITKMELIMELIATIKAKNEKLIHFSVHKNDFLTED